MFHCLKSASVLLVFVALGCGKESKEPDARILPVDGLTVTSLSLAAPEGRCEALKTFVEAFSVQHSPGVVRAAACEKNPASQVETLSFTFGRQGNDAREGSAAMTLLGAKVVVRLCNLSEPANADERTETSCFQVEGGVGGSGIPTAWRKDDLKIDDLVYSLQDYAAR